MKTETAKKRIMKTETAKKRIRNAIEKLCPKETEKVKNYLLDLTYDSFRLLELEYHCSSSKILNYCTLIDLEDNLESLLIDARKEYKKWISSVKLVNGL